MRLIGHLKTEAYARRFGDFLAGLDIKNQVESETDGSWAVWVYSEDQIESSKVLFDQFSTKPDDPKYNQSKGKTLELMDREEREQKDFEKKYHSRDTIWEQGGMGFATATLLALCVLSAFYSKFDGSAASLDVLRISESMAGNLPEVQHGEVWRLITPIFIHFGITHLLFNMLWLIDLGSRIEYREGAFKLVVQVVVFAALSNLGQYWINGPRFGGMSGVVYGLFGYIWIRGKCDPASGYYMDPLSTILMLFCFFFFCFAGENVANWTHGVGLVLGIGWGALPWLRNRLAR